MDDGFRLFDPDEPVTRPRSATPTGRRTRPGDRAAPSRPGDSDAGRGTPSRGRAPASGPEATRSDGPGASGPTTLTVSEVGRQVQDAVRAGLPGPVWVRGEVQNLRPDRKGHLYFELAEHDGNRGKVVARIRAVCWQSRARDLHRRHRDAGGLPLADGAQVRVLGRVEYFPPNGSLSLHIEDVDPTFTLGQIEAARKALVARLGREGLLDRNGRLALDLLPLRVALVTRRASAACQDVTQELAASGYPFAVEVFDGAVQGVDAPRDLTRNLRRVAARAGDFDVILLVRGGGSAADLAAFDHEDVARAVAGAPLPVLTGVGHETDRCVVDEVAHTAHKTPTKAAAFLVARVRAFDERTADASRRLVAASERLVAQARLRLARNRETLTRRATRETRRAAEHLAQREARLRRGGLQAARLARSTLRLRAHRLEQAAARGLGSHGHRLDEATGRLARAGPAELRRARTRVEQAGRRLGAAGPTGLRRARAHLVGAGGRLDRAAPRLLDRHAETLARAGVRLGRATPRHLARRRAALDTTQARLERVARRRLAERSRALDRAGTRLSRAAPRLLVDRARVLDVAEARLRALDPLTNLERGWSITRRADGTVVRDPADVAPGEAIRTRVAGGEITSVVAPDDGPGAPTSGAGHPDGTSTRPGGPQGGTS